jgi:hypothetical protein
MNLHTIEVAAAYSSLALYGIGVVGFLLFSLSFISTSFKHFVVCTLLSPVWPVFVAVCLVRGNKANKKSPKYIQLRR